MSDDPAPRRAPRSNTTRVIHIALSALVGIGGLASCSSGSKEGTQGAQVLRDGTTKDGCPPSDAAIALYKQCKAAKDEASCAAAKGRWGKVMFGISGPMRDACECSVPDDGCSCDEASDCLDECQVFGEWTQCPQKEGKCGHGGNGCRCLYMDGKVQGMCVN